MEIRIKVQRAEDRDNMILALANAGYSVYIEDEVNYKFQHTYYVVFNYEEVE